MASNGTPWVWRCSVTCVITSPLISPGNRAYRGYAPAAHGSYRPAGAALGGCMIAGSLRPSRPGRDTTPRGRLTCPAVRAPWRDRGNDEHDRATTGQDSLMRYVELRRYTDNEGDRLTPQGAADAEAIGRDGLHPPYAAFVSACAARATQMLEILRHAAGEDDTPITAAAGLRSSVEDRWRDAAKTAGKRADLEGHPGHRPGPGRARVLAARLGAAAGCGGAARGRPGAGGGPQPHHRGRCARARRPGCPATGQGQRGSAGLGRRGLPVGAAGLNGGERRRICA